VKTRTRQCISVLRHCVRAKPVQGILKQHVECHPSAVTVPLNFTMKMEIRFTVSESVNCVFTIFPLVSPQPLSGQ
jgi:hypothetical protein